MSASESVPMVFDYFDVPEGVEGTFRAKYKHCQTLISGSTKTTSIFLLHLKHLIMYLKYMSSTISNTSLKQYLYFLFPQSICNCNSITPTSI